MFLFSGATYWSQHSVYIPYNAFMGMSFLSLWLHLYFTWCGENWPSFPDSTCGRHLSSCSRGFTALVSSCFLCINRISIFLSLKGKVEKYPLQIPRAFPCSPSLHLYLLGTQSSHLSPSPSPSPTPHVLCLISRCAPCLWWPGSCGISAPQLLLVK